MTTLKACKWNLLDPSRRLAEKRSMKFLWLSLAVFFAAGCTQNHPRGSEKNPILISMVPSKDTKTLLLNAREMTDWLERETGLKFDIQVPMSYVAVVEALGSKKVDVAYLNTTTYLMARDKYGVEVKFISINTDGTSNYKGQFIARVDSKIKTIHDINKRKMAYVDPTSASGYILPAFQLKSFNIKPKEEVFAGRHDAVVTMVYQRQVDAGATYYAIPENGQIMDARRLVVAQFPDVAEKIKIIDFTIPLANDAFVFRRDLPEDLKKKIYDAFLKWSSSPEGLATLKKLSNASGLRPATHEMYEDSEKIIKSMKSSL
jgi:phosphonate transport system substrate-binding protein